MGIADRDYYRDDYGPPRRTGIGGLAAWNVTTWIIALNVAVFVIDLLLQNTALGYRIPAGFQRYYVEGPLEHWGFFSTATAIRGGQVWRFLTFQFLHANISHILFNMLGLYFFGPMIEDFLGRKRFIAFYLLCGAAGPVMYLVFQTLGVLQVSATTPLIGASAGVFGVLIAGAQVAPNATVMLLFPPIPMKLKTMAYVLLAIAAYTVFTRGGNAGGEAAHLGGAAVGFFLIQNPRLLGWAEKVPLPFTQTVRRRRPIPPFRG